MDGGHLDHLRQRRLGVLYEHVDRVAGPQAGLAEVAAHPGAVLGRPLLAARGLEVDEGGGAALDSGRVWVADPLDGTINYATGSPLCGVMLGLLASSYFLVFNKSNARRATVQAEIDRKQRNSFDQNIYAANGTTLLESFSTSTGGMPVNMFVASFTGATNFLPGRVLGREGEFHRLRFHVDGALVHLVRSGRYDRHLRAMRAVGPFGAGVPERVDRLHEAPLQGERRGGDGHRLLVREHRDAAEFLGRHHVQELLVGHAGGGNGAPQVVGPQQVLDCRLPGEDFDAKDRPVGAGLYRGWTGERTLDPVEP